MTLRQIKIPASEYERAIMIQRSIMQQEGENWPLWKCLTYNPNIPKKYDNPLAKARFK